MNNKALYNLTYGLYLLTAREGDKDNGCIINTAVQIANNPTRISISVIKENLTCEMITRTKEFNISALTIDTPFDWFKYFGMQSGRDVDKFATFSAVKRSENGLFYLTSNTNAFLSAKVTEMIDLGSHMLFIAEVTDGEVLSDAWSCTYAYYQSAIKPKPQVTEKKTWVCSICSYKYEGEDMPVDFICPWCNHGKEDFVLN